MKKLLMMVMVLASCLFCVNVNAEDDISVALEAASNTFYNWTYTNDGNWQFDETDEIAPEIVWNYMAYTMSYKFEDYVEYDMYTDPEIGEEWPTSAKFLVPAELFESVLKSSFDVTDSYIEEKIRYSGGMIVGSTEGYIEQNGEYFYSYEVQYGWGSTGEHDTRFYGYNDLGNNKYEVYSYFLEFGQLDESYDWIEYKPSSKEVYGQDYVISCYEYIDEDNNEKIYCDAGKILGYLKTVIEYDDENIKYLAAAEITKNQLPKVEKVSRYETEEIKLNTEEVNVYSKDGFVFGTTITIEKQTKGKIFDIASKALKEKFSAFVIYEINAKAGAYDVEPNGKVEISIKVPEGYKSPVIYYVTEDGKLEKLETTVKDGYATVEVAHFSTYAIVDEKVTVADKVEQVVDKVVENVVENPGTGLAGGVGLVAVCGGCGAYFYNRSKKKNKFPQS